MTKVEQEEKSGGKACIFPEDLINEILVRLPARSVARFRCVSKSFLAVASDPSFLAAHTGRAPKFLLNVNFDKSLLVFDHELVPLSGGRSASCRLMGLNGALCIASCNGLLCLTQNLRDLYPSHCVLNPLTGEEIVLPCPQPNGVPTADDIIAFYFHPSTGEFRILSKCGRVVQVFALGGQSWRQLEAYPATDPKISGLPVDMNGYMHWMANDYAEGDPNPRRLKILTFDIVSEEFRLMPPPCSMSTSCAESLVNVDGKLGYWYSGIDGTMVLWVLEDYKGWEWTKRFSVKCPVNVEWIYIGMLSFGAAVICITAEELLMRLGGLTTHLVIRHKLQSGDWMVENLDDHDQMPIGSLVYVESLLSFNTFLKE